MISTRPFVCVLSIQTRDHIMSTLRTRSVSVVPKIDLFAHFYLLRAIRSIYTSCVIRQVNTISIAAFCFEIIGFLNIGTTYLKTNSIMKAARTNSNIHLLSKKERACFSSLPFSSLVSDDLLQKSVGSVPVTKHDEGVLIVLQQVGGINTQTIDDTSVSH